MTHLRNGSRQDQPEKIAWPRPVFTVLLERSMSYADKVFWPFMMMAAQGWPFIPMSYGRTDLVRNKLATKILGSRYTHLIMLDVDHTHPPDIIQRLMAHFIKHPELQVVGGLNFRRGEPYEPCMFVRGDDGRHYSIGDWPRDAELIKVDAIGTGSIAIAREVFERMEPPWFFNDYSKVMDDVWPGEDMGFSEKCRELGIGLYVDPHLTSPHLIDSVIDEEAFQLYKRDKGLEELPIESVIKDLGERVIEEK